MLWPIAVWRWANRRFFVLMRDQFFLIDPTIPGSTFSADLPIT